MTLRSPIRSVVPIVVLAAGVAAAFGVAQGGAGRLLSQEVRSEDWEGSAWRAVRQGQLSVTHGPAGPVLGVLALSASPGESAPGRFRGETPVCEGNCLLVSSFDFGNANTLGGRFNTFSAGASTARLGLAAGTDGRRALTLDFTKAATGVCGAWIHLFDFTRPAAERIYLDASAYAVLTFWVRGGTGREQVLLKAADAEWERREDSLPLGDVAAFLESGRLDTSWQRAIVPLSALPRGLKPAELAVLVFEASGIGEGQLAVKDLAFCLRPDLLPGLSAPTPPAAPAVGQPGKAMWVWTTAQILPDVTAQERLIDFSVRNGFTDLFLQLPNAPANLGPSGEVRLDRRRWAALLTRLGRAGIRACALDGARQFALPENHDRVLKTVDNVVRYNALAPPQARFAGVHFDIEPYLLPGFHGTRRGRILSDYLTLVAGIRDRAKAAGMVVGVDIPFWYDSPDEFDGQRLMVDFNGQRKPASEHVIDLVDQVGVMDYRTVAYGADGFLGLAEGELRYAAAAGKRIFVGLETTELPDEELFEFGGEPQPGLPDQAPADRTVVIVPTSSGATMWLAPRAAWSALKTTPGVVSAAKTTPGVVSQDRTILWWPVTKVIPVPATKLTFARLGAGTLHAAMQQAHDELSRYPSFAGYAIHDYVGYRALLAPARPDR
jgi:hypothetical protein